MKHPVYTKGQLNCAETIIDSFNKNHNTNIPVALGSGMGSGLTIGSVCGAINAAAIVIGAQKGRELPDEENQAREIVKALLTKIKEKYGSEICIDLKKSNVSCQEIINFTYEQLDSLLK